MEKFIYKTISLLTHPLLIPTYTVLLIFNLPSYISLSPNELKNIVVIMIFLITFVMPSLSVGLMVTFKIVGDFTLNKRNDRNMPLIFTGIFFIGAFFVINNTANIQIPKQISSFLLLSSISIFITYIINLKTKISAHAIAAGLLFSFILVFMNQTNIDGFFPSIFLILFVSLSIFSRLALQEHNPSQIYFGLLIGIICGSFSYLL